MSIDERLEIARAQQRYDRQRIAFYENDKNEKIKAKFAREGVEHFFRPIVSQLDRIAKPKEPIVAEKRKPEEGQVAEAEGVEQPEEEGGEEAAGIVVEGQEEKPDGWEEEVPKGVVEEGAIGKEKGEVEEGDAELEDKITSLISEKNKKDRNRYLMIFKQAQELGEGELFVGSKKLRSSYLNNMTKEEVMKVLRNGLLGKSITPYKYAKSKGLIKPKAKLGTLYESESEGYQTGSGGNVISDRELVNVIKRYSGSIRGGNSSREARDFVEKGLWAFADAGQISSNLFGKLIKSF